MVLRELGQTGMSPSYIHFLILKLTGLDFPERTVDITTLVVFAMSLAVSVWLNVGRKEVQKDVGRKT